MIVIMTQPIPQVFEFDRKGHENLLRELHNRGNRLEISLGLLTSTSEKIVSLDIEFSDATCIAEETKVANRMLAANQTLERSFLEIEKRRGAIAETQTHLETFMQKYDEQQRRIELMRKHGAELNARAKELASQAQEDLTNVCVFLESHSY